MVLHSNGFLTFSEKKVTEFYLMMPSCIVTLFGLSPFKNVSKEQGSYIFVYEPDLQEKAAFFAFSLALRFMVPSLQGNACSSNPTMHNFYSFQL